MVVFSTNSIIYSISFIDSWFIANNVRTGKSDYVSETELMKNSFDSIEDFNSVFKTLLKICPSAEAIFLVDLSAFNEMQEIISLKKEK